MKVVSLSLICSVSLFVGTIISGSDGASSLRRTLQSSDTVIRTDLVRLIPFDVQIAIQDDSDSDSDSDSSASDNGNGDTDNLVIESLYPLLTDTITDWMMESFDIKTNNPNTQLVNNNTSFDSIALELIDQTTSTGTIDGQILNLVQVSFEGVSLWERVGTGTPPMEPEIVELIQRATFLEDKKLKDDLQTTINTLLIDLGMYEEGAEEQSPPILIVDVRAYITPTGTGGNTNNNNGSNNDSSANGNGNGNGNGSIGGNNKSLEIIIIVAIVVACLAFALLIFAVIWAWRSDRRDHAHHLDGDKPQHTSTERAVVGGVAAGASGGSKSSKQQQQQQRKSNKSSNKSATSNSSSKNKNKKIFGGGGKNRNSSATQKQRGGGSDRNSKNNKYDNNNNDVAGAGVADFPDILNNGSYPKEIGNVDGNNGNDTDDYDDSVVNGGTDNNQYPGDSVVSEDISSSLTAYYKSGMGYNNQGGQPRHHLINGNNNMGGGDDGASLSSMDSYGYSLDGYAPSLGPAQGGYPVGPLQAAKDAPIPIGDSMDEIGHMDIVQLQQEEESVVDYDDEPTPAATAPVSDNDEA
jgi:hypothetical protein